MVAEAARQLSPDRLPLVQSQRLINSAITTRPIQLAQPHWQTDRQSDKPAIAPPPPPPMLLGITEHDLESYLSQALAAGGDYADLYCEYLATSQLSIDESIVKSAIQGVSLGVGVRVISGELNKALGASRGLFCAADS